MTAFAAPTPAFAGCRCAPYSPSPTRRLNQTPGDWLNWRRTLDNSGYSPLDQVTTENVGELELAWAWPMPDVGQQETGPLVHDGIMFISTNNAIVDALDAKTGDLIWEYKHPLEALPDSWSYQRNQARRQRTPSPLQGQGRSDDAGRQIVVC